MFLVGEAENGERRDKIRLWDCVYGRVSREDDVWWHLFLLLVIIFATIARNDGRENVVVEG